MSEHFKVMEIHQIWINEQNCGRKSTYLFALQLIRNLLWTGINRKTKRWLLVVIVNVSKIWNSNKYLSIWCWRKLKNNIHVLIIVKQEIWKLFFAQAYIKRKNKDFSSVIGQLLDVQFCQFQTNKNCTKKEYTPVFCARTRFSSNWHR